MHVALLERLGWMVHAEAPRPVLEPRLAERFGAADEGAEHLGQPQTISISGNGKMNFPPDARNSFSRRTMPSLKCHGRTRK